MRRQSRRQGLWIGTVVFAALLSGLLSTSAILTAHLAYDPPLWIVLTLNRGWPLIATGLAWYWFRPTTLVGWELVLVGFLALSVDLAAAGPAFLRAFGLVGDAVALVGLTYLVLVIPARFPTRRAAVEIGLIGAAIVGGRAALILSGQDVEPLLPLLRCNSCAAESTFSPLASLLRPAGQDIGAYWRLGVAVLMGAILIHCFVSADQDRRAVLAPPAVTLALLMIGVALFELLQLSGASTRALKMVLIAGAFLVPYGFLPSLIVSRSRMARELARLTADLAESRTLEQVQDAVRSAVHDPELRLGFELPDTGAEVDLTGRAIELSEIRSGQTLTELHADGHRIVMIHSAPLPEDRDARAAVAGAARLAFDSDQLRSQLLRAGREMNVNRRTMVESLDSSRRRLERDLHDSAQQQVIAARMALARARDLAQGGQLRKRLEDIDDELMRLQDELRGVVREREPELLREVGLEAALSWGAARLPGRVSVTSGNLGRYPHRVETAVYFACLDVLQNPLRHRGPVAEPRMRLWESAGRLHFEISDPAREIDAARLTRSSGISTAVARIVTVGGEMEVRQLPGAGMVAAGWVPAGGAATEHAPHPMPGGR